MHFGVRQTAPAPWWTPSPAPTLPARSDPTEVPACAQAADHARRGCRSMLLGLPLDRLRARIRVGALRGLRVRGDSVMARARDLLL